MTVFSYKILNWDEDSGYETFTGLGLCESYADAARQIDKVYNIVEILSLSLLEEGATLISLPEEMVEDYKSKMFPDIEYGVKTDNKGVPLNA